MDPTAVYGHSTDQCTENRSGAKHLPSLGHRMEITYYDKSSLRLLSGITALCAPFLH
jgi:hypothetical protein